MKLSCDASEQVVGGESKQFPALLYPFKTNRNKLANSCTSHDIHPVGSSVIFCLFRRDQKIMIGFTIVV